MGYQKQNFANGNVLTAENLNHMENGIAGVESTANETKTVVDKIIDPTLSISGKAADAKATGDAVGELKEDLSELESIVKIIQEKLGLGTVDTVTVNEINDMIVEYFENKTVSEVEA